MRTGDRAMALVALLALALAGGATLAVVGERGVRTASRVPDAARVVRMEIGGMTCRSCVAKVGHTLRAVPGVASVQVDLTTQSARVVCDPSVPDSTLIAAVRHAGPEYLGLIPAR